MKKTENKENNIKVKDKKKKNEISPYQKFLLSQDPKYRKYKQSYFDFYDDVKDKTHKMIDW